MATVKGQSADRVWIDEAQALPREPEELGDAEELVQYLEDGA